MRICKHSTSIEVENTNLSQLHTPDKLFVSLNVCYTLHNENYTIYL